MIYDNTSNNICPLQHFTTSMEACFTAICRGITHPDLIAESNLIMSDDETSRLWRKIFIAHEQGTLPNPDKPGSTFLDDHVEAQQKLRARHEKGKKSTAPFEDKPYICKPLTRETFRCMMGLTRSDYKLLAQRILYVRPGEDLPRVTLRATKNLDVTSLKWWCNFRKWKNILLQELSLRDPNQLGIWGKDSEGFEGLNRSVWSKFKKDHGVTKAKWVKLYDSAGETWLNKKRAANFKKLEAPPKLDKELQGWLQTHRGENHSQYVTRFVDYSSVRKQLVIPSQDQTDHEWLSRFSVTAGFIDFRFIPGCVDQPVPSSVVESLVKHVVDPLWQPGLKTIPAWMIVSDLHSHPAAVEFISALCRKHPETFINVPSVYLPCPAEDLPVQKEVDSKRSSPFLYVDFLTCSATFPRHKVFKCPMLAPDTRRYTVKLQQWTEQKYEVNRGELRMETYFEFLKNLGTLGGVVINIFGGLKPIAAALMKELNVFSYMDYSFLHTLPEKIAHVRALQAADFEEDDDEAGGEEDRQVRPQQQVSPPLFLVSAQLGMLLSTTQQFVVR